MKNFYNRRYAIVPMYLLARFLFIENPQLHSISYSILNINISMKRHDVCSIIHERSEHHTNAKGLSIVCVLKTLSGIDVEMIFQLTSGGRLTSSVAAIFLSFHFRSDTLIIGTSPASIMSNQTAMYYSEILFTPNLIFFIWVYFISDNYSFC